MNLLLMSYRNLFRQKLRTFLTATALAFGVLIAFLADSMIIGLSDQTLTNMRETSTGWGKLMTKENFESKTPSYDYVFNYADFKDALPNDERGLGEFWTSRIVSRSDLIFYQGDGFIEDGYRSMKMVAIDPVRDEKVFPLTWEEGEFVTQTPDMSESQPVYISEYLATKIGAKMGSPMLVATFSKTGSNEAIDLVVAGIFNTPDSATNRSQFFVNQETLINFLGFEENEASEIAFSQDKLPAGIKLSGDLHYYSWQEMGKDVIALLSFASSEMSIINLFVFIIASIGIINTIMLSIYERYREIGTLRAFGMRQREIVSTFVWEGILIGVLGALIGLTIATLINIPFTMTGIDYSELMEKVDGANFMPGKLKGAWNFNLYWQLPLYAVGISGLFAFLTARGAFKKPIVDCLR